jgi:hypothetical protein
MLTSDTFLGLTETGWVAVGSLVSACSIVFLSVLNWKSLKAAQEAASAAADQATVAKESLKELNAQFRQQEIAQKETAIELLEELSRSALNWKSKLHVDYAGEVKLFPSNWISVLVFTSLQAREIRSVMVKLESQIADTERKLVAYMHKNPVGRQQITSETRALDEALDITANDTRVIADQLRGWNAT